MKSLDTNLLYYAVNEDCEEHAKAGEVVDRALESPAEWLISDQVYFELYGLLRNPAVLERPLAAADAWERVDFFRNRTGWLHCSYETSFMVDAVGLLKNEKFPARRTFDLVLAITLKRNGVQTFYTRNPKDFDSYGWFSVVDPL